MTRKPLGGITRTGTALETDRRHLAAGALVGLLVGTTSSAAILATRVVRGESWVVLATDALVAAFAVLVLALTSRRPFDPLRCGTEGRAPVPGQLSGALSAQAAGAVLGILLVHLALRLSPLRACSWLCERPPQLVNDLVASFGALALLWTCARQPVAALSSVLAVGIAALYSLTSSRWHLDAWGGTFALGGRGAISVQLAVLVQLAATAVGVSVFHRLSATSPARS